jgi:hypothetical protein
MPASRSSNTVYRLCARRWISVIAEQARDKVEAPVRTLQKTQTNAMVCCCLLVVGVVVRNPLFGDDVLRHRQCHLAVADKGIERVFNLVLGVR